VYENWDDRQKDYMTLKLMVAAIAEGTNEKSKLVDFALSSSNFDLTIKMNKTKPIIPNFVFFVS
jgi:hypothetical protein